MRSVWLLLIWLLAFALPAQGAAAAAMLNCPHAPARVAASHDQAAAHRHSPMSAQGASRSDAQAQQHRGDAQATDATDATAHGGTTAKACSACAGCCVGLALPSVGATAPQSAFASNAALPALAVHVVAFLTSGPDRPPRAHAA